MKKIINMAAAVVSFTFADAAVLVEEHSMRDYVKLLRGQALDDTDFADFGKSYTAPSNAQLTSFATMAGFIAAGDLGSADNIAGGLGYEVVNLTDSVGGGNYYHLRETTSDGKVINGWGSYFFNPNSTRDVLIQAPHILHDTHSYDVATVALIHSGARGMMFNGTHRDSGGAADSDVADVAHLAQSVFNTVHETWTTNASVQAWQIHGFDIANSSHATIPAGTDVVLSNGDGSVSQEIKNLDAQFELKTFINDAESIAHAYNTLDVNDPDNAAVNGNVDGDAMKSLGGTNNVQGIYTRSLGGTFVHIELDQSIRLDGTLAEDLENRERAGLAIASAIQLVPEPSSVVSVIFGAIVLFARRRRVRSKG